MKHIDRHAAFSFRFTALMLLGYLLGSVPQIILDPILTTHKAFGPRTYEYGWLVVPIAVIMTAFTLLLSREKVFSRRPLLLLTPFTCSIFISIPIFTPELPHMNLASVWFIWVIVAFVLIFIRKIKIINPGEKNPLPDFEAQLEFVKVQSAFWKNIAIGIVGVYIALLIGSVTGLQAFNSTYITNEKELFILNMYSALQIGIISLFIFFGPVLESVLKVINANKTILEIQRQSGKVDA